MPSRRAAAPLLAALILLGAAAAAAAEEGDPPWIDRAALEQGEILVDVPRNRPAQRVQVQVAALIAARPEEIWDVLTACELAPEYVPNVVSCRRLEEVDDGRAELFVQVVKPAFFLPRFEHVFRLDYEPYERVHVSRVSGPIAYMSGTWELLPQDDGRTLLLYELEVDPGMPVPRFWVRATMRRDLPKIVEAVRDLSEQGAGR